MTHSDLLAGAGADGGQAAERGDEVVIGCEAVDVGLEFIVVELRVDTTLGIEGEGGVILASGPTSFRGRRPSVVPGAGRALARRSSATPMQSFAEATTWTPDGPGAWAGRVSPGWMQGRGAFGGIPAAVGLRAIRAVCDDDRHPRSIHVAFLGPLTEQPARVTAQVLRQGRFVTHARAEIHQDDALRTQITVTLAHDRPSALVVQAPPAPSRPEPDRVQALPYREGLTPAFTQFLDMRWTDGGLPFSGSREPRLGGWCRHRTDPGSDPHVALLGMLDAWPSPVISMLKRPAPGSSVSWSSIFHHVPPAVTTEDWWWYGSEVVASRHGYTGMRASLYDRAGRLVGTVEQLVAMFDQPA